MDHAVALVQAYLRVNGYFTVSEYPIVEAMGPGQYRAATDLDILAFRFPHAGRLVPGSPGVSKAVERFEPAPELGCPSDRRPPRKLHPRRFLGPDSSLTVGPMSPT